MKLTNRFKMFLFYLLIAVCGSSCASKMKLSAADRFPKNQCKIEVLEGAVLSSRRLISTCANRISLASEITFNLLRKTRTFHQEELALSDIDAGIKMIDDLLRLAANGNVFQQPRGSILPAEADGFWKNPGYIFIGIEEDKLNVVFYIGSASVIVSRLDDGSIAANYVIY